MSNPREPSNQKNMFPQLADAFLQSMFGADGNLSAVNV